MINKIIHITLGKANPNRMNGINKVVNSLAIYQAKQMASVEVWGITKTPESGTFQREYNLRLFKSLSFFKLEKQLKQAISDQNPSCRFHIHGSFNYELYLVAKLLTKLNFKYIYTSHGAFNRIAMSKSFLKKKIYSFLFERSIVKNAYKMHFIGSSEVEGASEIFTIKKRYFLLPNGQEKIYPLSVKDKRSSGKMIFGFIGRLDIKTKGLDILFNAIKKIPDHLRNEVEFWIIGGGEGISFIENEIEKNKLGSFVKLLGPVYGDKKNDLIKKMNFLCLNSRNEGMPGVVLESLSHGVPVIISQETNLGDVISDFNAGYVTSENDSNCLVQSILDASSQSQHSYLEMSKNAIKTINDVFDWNLIAKKMIENYA